MNIQTNAINPLLIKRINTNSICSKNIPRFCGNERYSSGSYSSSLDTTKDCFFSEIPSYRKEKEKFWSKYFSNILNPGYKGSCSASILVSCYDDEILNNFQNAIKKSCINAGVNYSEIKYGIDKDLIKQISLQLKANKDYYNKTGKRSIIFINNSELFMGMNCKDVQDRTDLNIKYFNANELNRNNTLIITKLKSVTDNCHKLPDNSVNGSATTFVFFTKKPLLIHPDFRDGRTEKFHLKLAKGVELQSVFMNIFEKTKKALILKLLNEDLSEIFPNQSKEQLINNLNNMNIKEGGMYCGCICGIASPNHILGGYSCKNLSKIIEKAFIKTLDNSNILPLSYHLCNILCSTPRDISANEVKQQNLIDTEPDEYELYKSLSDEDLLDYTQNLNFQKIIMKEKKHGCVLNAKKEKGYLTPDEEVELEKLNSRYKNNFEYKEYSKYNPKMISNTYGITMEFEPDEFVDLYRGKLGYDKTILWLEPATLNTVNAVIKNLDLIKQTKLFNSVCKLQFAEFGDINKLQKYEMLDLEDKNGHKIVQIDLSNDDC